MATAKKKSTYEILSAVKIADKVEKKGGLDYLSWANAWDMLKKAFPNAQRNVYEDVNGMNYFNDGLTGWVKVGIVVEDVEHIDYLPIMDFRNKAIPLEKITSFDVNKTIQRATAKAIAMHGLGLSLWTGEDLKSGDTKGVATTNDKTSQRKPSLVVGDNDNWARVKGYVEKNKSLGVTKIASQLRMKYSLPEATKTEINRIIRG